jgi:hypothetical protein
VSHHARDFRFFGRRVEHAALHEHRSVRQRERVDVFQIHRRERVLVDRLLQFRRRRGDEAVANLREVLRDVLVVDDGVLLAELATRLPFRTARPASACTFSSEA